MGVRTDELLRKIRTEIEREERELPPLAKPPPQDLRRSPSLAALARLAGEEPPGELTSHRPIVGPVIVAAKRVLRRLVLAVLDPRFVREREFRRELLRYQSEAAARSEHLATELTRAAREMRERLDGLEARVRELEKSRD